METRTGDTRLLIVLIVTCFALTSLLARVRVTQKVQQSPLSLPLPVAEERALGSNVQPLDVEASLPPETVLRERFEADLDNDGRSEVVLIFDGEQDRYGSGVAGIMVVGHDAEGYRKIWEARPSSEGRVSDVVIRDINMDGVLEVLLFKSTSDEAKHFLYVFAWNDASYTYLSPDGGVLAGEEAFISAYYPPEVQNADSTSLDEIVVFEDGQSSDRLKAIVYRWNGEVYTFADWIVVLGPPR